MPRKQVCIVGREGGRGGEGKGREDRKGEGGRLLIRGEGEK